MPYQTLLSGLYPPSPKLGLIEGFFKEGSSALKKPSVTSMVATPHAFPFF